MRWRWITLAGVALILVLAAAAYLVLKTYDYAKLKPRIERMAAKATGRKLTLGGEIGLDFGLSPTLIVTDVALSNAPWASKPQMITARRIEAKVRLLPLLFGDVELKYLTLAGVDVVLTMDAAGQRNWEFTAPAGSAAPTIAPSSLSIAVEDVRVKSLSVTYRDEKAARTTLFNLAGLELARQADPKFLALKLQADYNGQPVELAGRIGQLQQIVSGDRFPLELAGRVSSVTVNIAGSIGEVRTLHGIDLNLRAEGKNLQEVGRDIGTELPQTDAFDLSGHLAGSGQSPMLENISGNVSAGGTDLAVSGRIGNLIALQDLDLQLKGSGKDLAQVGALVGQKLPSTDEFMLEGHLKGSGREMSLQDIQSQARRGSLRLTAEGTIGDLAAFGNVDLQLKGSGKDLAQLESIVGQKLPSTDEFMLESHLKGSGREMSLQDIQGQARRGNLGLTAEGTIGDLAAFGNVDLQLKGSGKDLAQLESIVGQKLPSTDEFMLEGHLKGSGREMSLQDIQGQARRGSLHMKAEGTIGDLAAFGKVDLQLKGSGKDLAQLETIVGQKLPPTDEFALDGRLAGSGRALSLQDIRGEARRGSLRLTAGGAIGDLLDFRHVDLQLKGTGKNLAQAEAMVGQKLPPTDEFALDGRLTGSGRALSLRDIKGQARRGSLRLTAAGELGDLLGFRQVDLRLKGVGRDLSEVEAMVGLILPPTDAFEVDGRLTGSAGAFSLQEARGRARHGSLRLEVSGVIQDLNAFAGIDLRVIAGGKELAEIGPLIGTTLPDLGPFDLRGSLSGSAQSFSLRDLTAVVDQSDFNGWAQLEIRQRPKITLVLESSLLDMTALLKNLELKEKEPNTAPSGLEGRLFSNDPLPLDILKQVDADVRLNAKNVRARDANFELGRLILTLENGDLKVDTLQANYKQTRISGNFHLYPESPPRVAAKFLVQDFDLGGLLRELRINDEVRSHLDIAIDAKSRGRSMHDLMAGLDGSVGAVMGQGYLTHYLDLLSVGLTRKVIHFWGSHKKGGEIKCAVVQFDIKNGIADSRAFVFDTEAGVLTGEGDINLDTENVNFLLVPKPRYPSIMNFWTKLRVSGPIMDPKVRPDTVSLLSKGAKALSALVIGPLGLLAPFVNLGAHKAHPCNVHGIGK
jgi:uncharacterized protein involved in outer membrane biogenesis